MNINPFAEKKEVRVLLVILGIIGIICLFWAALIESEEESIFFAGISKTRIYFIIFFLILLIAFILFVILTFTKKNFHSSLIAKLEQQITKQTTIYSLLFTLFILSLLSFLIQFSWFRRITWEFNLFHSIFANDINFFESVFIKVQPFIIWFLLIFLSLLLYLVIWLISWVKKNGFFNKEDFSLSLLLFVMAITTILYWVILINQVNIFSSIPGWYWDLKLKPLENRDFILVIILILIYLFINKLSQKKINKQIALPVCFILGLIIQYSFGYIDGGGINSLKEKYLSSYHRNYVQIASKYNDSIISSIRNYEDETGMDMFTITKPPGLMAGYYLLEKFVNGSPSIYGSDTRFERLANALTCVFPLLSLSVIFLFPLFYKLYFNTVPIYYEPIIAGLIFILLPNQNLIVLMADQAIYSILFLLSLILFKMVIDSKSWVFSLLYGFYLYFIFFITFSLLPLLIFLGLYLLLSNLATQNKKNIWDSLIHLSIMTLGSILCFFVFYFLLNYNAFSRFEIAMKSNYEFIQSYNMRIFPISQHTMLYQIKNLLPSIKINFLEYTTAIGVPVSIIFLYQCVAFFFQKKPNQKSLDIIVGMIFYFTFFAMFLSGSNYGEVARLWIFFNTIIAISVSNFIAPIITRRKDLFLSFIFFQFMTMIIIFHFQDLHV